MARQHNIDNGADCWCEPRIDVVGEDRIFIHSCDDCQHNPCICAENLETPHASS